MTPAKNPRTMSQELIKEFNHLAQNSAASIWAFGRFCEEHEINEFDDPLPMSLDELSNVFQRLYVDKHEGGKKGESSHSELQLDGHKWLTVAEAIELSKKGGRAAVPARTIREACNSGAIKNAEKRGRDWLIPQGAFIYWLHNRPKPGPKIKGNQ